MEIVQAVVMLHAREAVMQVVTLVVIQPALAVVDLEFCGTDVWAGESAPQVVWCRAGLL